jgi:hypothetical protein
MAKLFECVIHKTKIAAVRSIFQEPQGGDRNLPDDLDARVALVDLAGARVRRPSSASFSSAFTSV